MALKIKTPNLKTYNLPHHPNKFQPTLTQIDQKIMIASCKQKKLELQLSDDKLIKGKTQARAKAQTT